jgi:hypothetical protein
MKPTFDISEGLLDNLGAFEDPFFRRFQLRPAPAPLRLTESISKDYLFPTLYGDVTCAMAIFLCPYARAAALLPHPRLRPVRTTRGRAAVAFSCYEYRNVLGVAPYNEIAMTIPVLADPAVDLPLLPLVTNLFPSAGYYVFSMPVTSLENQIRGRKIWGLPKVVQEIDLREEGGDFVTTAMEDSGEPYFTLRVPMGGTPTDFDVSANLYSRLGARLLRSRTCFAGRFNVVKHMSLLWRKGVRPDQPVLTLGDTPSGRLLRELELEEHPFQTRFARGVRSCFDLADPDFRTAIAFDGGEA